MLGRQERAASDTLGEERGGGNPSLAGKQVRGGPRHPLCLSHAPSCPVDASNSCTLQEARSPASQTWPPLGWPRAQLMPPPPRKPPGTGLEGQLPCPLVRALSRLYSLQEPQCSLAGTGRPPPAPSGHLFCS